MNTKRNARCVTMTIFSRHYTENSSFVKTSADFKKCFPLNKRVNLRRKKSFSCSRSSANFPRALINVTYEGLKNIAQTKENISRNLSNACKFSFVRHSKTKDHELVNISFSSRHSLFLPQPQIKCCSLLGFKRFTLTSTCLYIQGRYGWCPRTHFIIND